MLVWLIITTLLYIIGYPAFCVYMLRQACKETDRESAGLNADIDDTKLGAHRRTATYGFMLKDIKPGVYMWRLTQLPASTVLAMTSVFAEENNVRLVSAGVLYIIVSIGTSKHWPMQAKTDNLILFATSFGNSLLSTVLLFIAAFTTSSGDVEEVRESGEPVTSLILAIVVTVGLVVSIPVLLRYRHIHAVNESSGAEEPPTLTRMGGMGGESRPRGKQNDGGNMERAQALFCAFC
jgi:hypothetical protein